VSWLKNLLGMNKTPAPNERALSMIVDALRELTAQQKEYILPLLRGMIQQQQKIREDIQKLMPSIQDLNNIESQLAIDVDQQNKDIEALNAAQNSTISALNQALASLKQENPNVDITVLTSISKAFEANHDKLVSLANSATAATAGAQTTLTANLSNLQSGQVPASDTNASAASNS
jgi:predicted  nucleic acid-binding Zn-ribbon protein